MTEILVADDYQFARLVLTRGLAIVYLVAFLNVRNQFRPLLGEAGLLPVPAFLAGRDFSSSPSLFHLRYSDRLVTVVAWVGMILAAGLVLGVGDRIPLWANGLWWLALWALYLTVVNVGQTFYAFGWESLLLEAGFLAAFLGNASVAPPLLTILAFRWLLFRVEFGAGMIKLRGDPCWRDLTCLHFHHETQPMPGPMSRWFHHLPGRMHKAEVAGNHLAQLVAPFALFLPQPVAGTAAVVMIVTQAYLILSGNYAWLNLTTLLLGFSAIPDGWFASIGLTVTESAGPVAWFDIVVVTLTIGTVWLSRRPVRNLFQRGQLMNFSFNPFHLVNAYGAFGSVTRHRRELVIEGTLSAEPDEDDWLAYEFKGKPGDPGRRPPQWAPYHLRLDWLMWFVPLSPRYGHGWLEPLVDRLLAADAATLGLLRTDPFDGKPPRWVRGRLVDYRFSTSEEGRSGGGIWVTGDSRALFGPTARSNEP